MIVARRPITIFDVDLVGAGALAVLLLGGCFAIAAPAMRNRAECHRIQGEIVAAQNETARVETARRKAEASLGRFRDSLVRRSARMLAADGLSPYLARLAACAEESGIEIIQLQPAAPQKSGPGQQCDVRVNARGGFAGFVHFLDLLRRETDCQRLIDVAITSGGSPDGVCTLAFTVRLSLLPEPVAPSLAAGPASTGGR